MNSRFLPCFGTRSRPAKPPLPVQIRAAPPIFFRSPTPDVNTNVNTQTIRALGPVNGQWLRSRPRLACRAERPCPYAKAAGDNDRNPREPDRHRLGTDLYWYLENSPYSLECRDDAEDAARHLL